MWKYKEHKNTIFGIGNHVITEGEVIYIKNFNTWYSLFNQDRRNWSYIINNNGSYLSKYMLPFYFNTNNNQHYPTSIVYYIKFCSKKDYKRFIKMTKNEEIRSLEQLKIDDEIIRNSKKIQDLQEHMKINKERRASSVSQ